MNLVGHLALFSYFLFKKFCIYIFYICMLGIHLVEITLLTKQLSKIQIREGGM